MILGEGNYSLIEEDTPMTLSDTATAQLWEAFRAGGGAGLIREAVELVLQELIEAEAAERIGAGHYERSDARVNRAQRAPARACWPPRPAIWNSRSPSWEGQLLAVDA